MAPAQTSSEHGFLTGCGELGALTASHDWSRTPLGRIESWPVSLRTMAGFMLRSPQPMVLLWGQDGVMLYNDAYLAFARARHPELLGSKVREDWPEVAAFDAVMRVGLAGGVLANSSQDLTLRRSGEPGQVWIDLDYSPVPDETGRPAGVLAMVSETTARVTAERQRAQAESEARVERNRARGLLEGMAEAVLLMDHDFRVLEINDQGLRLDARAREEIVGESHWDVWPDTKASELGALYRRAMAERVPVSLEHHYIWPTGRESWIDMRAYPVGEGLAVFFRDVTERRAAEERWRSESERVQLALDAGAIIGTWVWDVPADRFTADERFAASFDLDPELCRIGLSLKQVTESIHVEDRARVEASMAQALARGASYRCEYRVRKKDAGYRWVEANGRAEVGPDGSATRFPGVLLDIEARRAAEAERDEAAALLSTFAEAVPGVVYAKDREGRMLVANRGATELIGKPRQDYIGKTDADFLDDKQQAAVVMATDKRIMDSGVAEQVEEVVDYPDGSRGVWLSSKVPIRNPMGEVVGLIGSSIDITDRNRAERSLQELNETLEQRIETAVAELRHAEEALRQSQKMEAVGQLTGGIAHDFNNLLAGISGSLELIRSRMAQGRFDTVERYIHAAEGAAKRAAALTQRLLAFSRRQTLDPRPTDLNRLVAGMEEIVRRTVGPSIQIEVVGAGGLWPTLIDPVQLDNALLNLCINGRDAMPDGGRLTIETANKWLDDRAATVRDLAPGQYVTLCVTDTGTGMTPEVQARAFDPFFTTKPIGSGTGLGLSMIYGFVRQSGGQVRIYSELGQGTTMCLYLPRYLGEIDQRVDSRDDKPDHSVADGETVLIVDDEPTVRMLVTEILEEHGYAAVEAADAAAGLKVLESDLRIDLLVTDVGLPGGMNGRQLADAGRALRPGLKVLFITGYAENAVIGNGHLEHGMAILTKPFAMEQLASKIRSTMES